MQVLTLHSLAVCAMLFFTGSSLRVSKDGKEAEPGVLPEKKAAGPEKRFCSTVKPKRAVIIGGTVVNEPNEFPFLAWLGDNREKGHTTQFCGGTLIHPRVVLTAGHCLYNDNWRNSDVTVRLRLANSLGSPGIERSVINWMRHSDYNLITLFEDLSLILLNESVPTSLVKPVILSNGTQEFERSGDKTIVGWGSQDEQCSMYDTNLRKTDVPLGTYGPTCQTEGSRRLTRAHDFDVSRQLCAGDYRGHMHYPGCGDSGGPLLARDGSHWVQVGMVSWSYGVPFPDVFTRVSHYTQWIQKGIAQLLQEGRRPVHFKGRR